MGLIKQNTRLNNWVRIFRIEGEVQAEAVQAAVKAYLDSKTGQCALWDFSLGSIAFRDNEGGRRIHGPRRDATVDSRLAKTALVCPNELDYGLFRILHVFSSLQSYPRDLRVFRREKPAWRWLKVCRRCFMPGNLCGCCRPLLCRFGE